VPEIDPNDHRAPYQQIANELRRAIQAAEYEAGQRLPSNRDLATAYGVAPMTVSQAFRVLREEGLVKTVQGRGVFVRGAGSDQAAEPDPEAVLAHVNQLLESMHDQIADLETRVSRLESADSPPKPRRDR
jgi:DNA-binding GntR family transcriptional regulator